MKLIITALSALLITACSSMPDASDAENGVICFEGTANGSYPMAAVGGRTNGVWLDSDVDVTQVSPEQWIALYEAFCQRGN